MKLLFFFLIGSMLQPDTVEIEITFISESVGGSINLAIYDQKESFMDNEISAYSYPFTEGKLTVKLQVPNKPIAISSFHDLDNDKELSTNWVGIPNEPYGFSNNARGTMGPPKYSECVIDPSQNQNLILYLK